MDQRTKMLFAAVDAKDADAFAAFLTADAVFRFGNAPIVRGRAAIREAVAAFFAAIRGLRHQISEQWECGNAVTILGDVTYTRLDGSALTVPFAVILKIRDSSVSKYLIYADASQLFAGDHS